MALKRGAPHSSPPPPREEKPSHKRQSKKIRHDQEEQEDLFWYPAMNTPPPDNYTPGMMLLLKKALTYSRSRGKTRRAFLCQKQAIYLSGQSWDRGWGCGYRNFMMICSTLVDQQEQPMYYPLLDSPIRPGVRQLQLWLEVAWADGYDAQGAQQLKQLSGTNKWIGVSDLYTAFSSRGIPCELVDFNYSQSFSGNDMLMKWIINHFTPTDQPRASSATAALMTDTIIFTERMPIILQDGFHSRTVVGFEEVDSSTINLLVFDPSRWPRSKIRNASLALLDPTSHAEISNEVLRDALSYFRYHIHRNVFGKQWQVLYFPMSEPLTEYQMHKRKFVTSIRA